MGHTCEGLQTDVSHSTKRTWDRRVRVYKLTFLTVQNVHVQTCQGLQTDVSHSTKCTWDRRVRVYKLTFLTVQNVHGTDV